ncbi:exopolysaccharide biosynthesis polyprenyl glycosylphosphotransferase [Arthrobacter yangruifuii]|uniref:Exopolysaccharide biosynthesis polyprenyl glycosylphosphotransferase n=2 Tax=Arthrobacter yangruifuii TaxID=2606616 RepID=A0A5N6MID5_9MICC|nr:sugar transferase [Arthrobacter yangruifuii]KAD3515255.1 exopolysaccharide biosynthesis polyprenyl glycosylphosphotransferase [Arthrobacter yangruifuii]
MANWRKHHIRVLAIVDGVAVVWAMSGALVLRFGTKSGMDWIDADERPYLAITLILSAIWWCMLGLWGSRDTTILGYGPEEYKRLISASFWLFGLIATVSYVFQLDTARGYIAIALPAGIISLLMARMLVRSYLRSQRRAGSSSSSILIIGGPHGVEHLTRALRSHPMAGYRPIASYIPGAQFDTSLNVDPDLPILGSDPSAASIIDAIDRSRPDAVALSSGVPLPPRVIRELGWALADMQVKMIMAPALTDVAGPRIHTQPVAGLPLIHVSTPNLGSGQRILKRAFDLAGAIFLVVLLSPILLAVIAIVRFDSPGPVFFTQERVGNRGVHFKMFKFRSMVVDAEARLDALRAQSEGNGVMFKLKADPRITRAGRFLRRYSLDELPQLFNVLNGTMSLVGPRPPLPSEVELYQSHVRRRLMVRPGLTGLWQVSGRSLLSWDDTVRLDLYYVENWSVPGDIAILLKTFRAVLARQGAY